MINHYQKREQEENYEKLQGLIQELGGIKKILNDRAMIKMILAYPGDRRLLYVFIEEINKSMEQGIIDEKDLELFRNGELISWIINLEKITTSYTNRELYISEKADKISYISIINDIPSLITSYTNPIILTAICDEANLNDNSNELASFLYNGVYNNLPKDVKTCIKHLLQDNKEAINLLLELENKKKLIKK